MRVGSLVYATDQGLGILAKSFHDHGIVTDVMVVRHGTHPENDEWYPNSARIGNFNAQRNEIVKFCASMEAMLFFETPFRWSLIDICKTKGVKTALMVMHECLHLDVWWHRPDLFLCPSLLDVQCIGKAIGAGAETPIPGVEFIPVPVEVPWRQRARCETFVHNAGHGGLKGRNGTSELLQAFRLTKSPAKLIIRSQKHKDWPPYPELLGKVELTTGTVPYGQLFVDGDCFIFPEKFNGLSLPLQEARAAGMLVMCGNRFPMNEWLPRGPLISVAGYHRDRIGPAYQEYDCAEFDPRTIAATIDAWYGRDITAYSDSGLTWARNNSWAVLGPKYKTVLEKLL